jgi:hypothetical protein
VENNKLKGPFNTLTKNFQNSPEAYNKYFLSIPKNIIDGIGSKNNQSSNTPKTQPNIMKLISYVLSLYKV